MDQVLEDNNKEKYLYHGYASEGKNQIIVSNYCFIISRLSKEGYVIPEDEILDKKKFESTNSAYIGYKSKQMFENLEYQPPTMREKFQISLWRIDEYGIVKTKSR